MYMFQFLKLKINSFVFSFIIHKKLNHVYVHALILKIKKFMYAFLFFNSYNKENNLASDIDI